MKLSYPTSFAKIGSWAAQNAVPLSESRLRFAQFAVLCAIAGSPELGSTLVFKGGNALDFVYRPNRSTLALDFSVDMTLLNDGLDTERLRVLLTEAIRPVDRELGVSARVQRVQQQPPGPNRTFITFHATIGYALPNDARLRQRMLGGEPSPAIVPVEISLNEPICAASIVDLGDSRWLRVSDIDDIVAEKLQALLQQPIRNRARPQDVLDIALILRDGPRPNPARVATFLKIKAAARNVPVSRAAFREPAVIERARLGYDELAATTRRTFIRFEDAYELLDRFIFQLHLPDTTPQ